ncbi:glycoside hydrolase family 13 protein [Pterulicium gracile]|uniref:Glycoside hydrolase family 13 protein n=1 Tax=Pterulicium gracile TaxID=1884261 RepID=A0A5C3Q2S9_9AGAR|nr:glycoside hydrolase family 13 protein [Pterula gracilis]
MSPATTTSTAPFTPTKTWWKSAVIYQIYTISFLDSNGDGLGDLKGIESKLDYLKDLGVDVIWMSPIYPSPLADVGYDISDYRTIDSRYGTLEDFDELVKGCKERGIKVVMDLVANHTSDEHEWFIDSKSSKTSSKRDWYMWRPPTFDADGNRQPPNNWRSHFEGSAWEYDGATEEYYLHLYDPKQPDLNWENEEVRKAVFDIMLFWVNRGVEGFRLDVISEISKVKGLPDAPITESGEPYQWGYMHYVSGPRVHEFLKEMHQTVMAHHDLITIGETPRTYSAETIASYVLPQNDELNMVFHFEVVGLDTPPNKGNAREPKLYQRFKLGDLKQTIGKWQGYKREEGFWNTIYIENHDQSRSVSKFGDDSEQWRTLSAKLLAVLQITQSGTLFVYQGEELGLKNFPKTWGIEEYKDVWSGNYYRKVEDERRARLPGGKGEVDMSDIIEGLAMKARDHARVPVQWDSSPHGGFTTGTPWMRVNEDYATWNAAAQVGEKDSVFAFWKEALGVRKENDVLIYGDYEDLLPSHEHLFVYKRTLGEAAALVFMNFSDKEVDFELDLKTEEEGYRLVLANYADAGTGVEDGVGKGKMRGWEARVWVK